MKASFILLLQAHDTGFVLLLLLLRKHQVFTADLSHAYVGQQCWDPCSVQWQWQDSKWSLLLQKWKRGVYCSFANKSTWFVVWVGGQALLCTWQQRCPNKASPPDSLCSPLGQQWPRYPPSWLTEGGDTVQHRWPQQTLKTLGSIKLNRFRSPQQWLPKTFIWFTFRCHLGIILEAPETNSPHIAYFHPPLTLSHRYLLLHLPHFHAPRYCAALPAISATPDHRTAPSVTGLSRFFPGIISYQLLTFPPGPALSSSAPEQRSTARHNWGRYHSPMAANLQCLYPPTASPFPSSPPRVVLCVPYHSLKPPLPGSG